MREGGFSVARLGHKARLAALATTGAAALVFSGCGGTGEGDKPSCILCGTMNTLRGSISSQSGLQAQMQGWAVATLERNTGIARVAEVDSAGLYQLNQVKTDLPQTIILLSPDYIVQSVLSIPGVIDKTIRQFVTFGDTSIPKLIQKGPIVTLQDYAGLTVTKDIAADANGDGIPDGSESLGAKTLSLAGSPVVDTDLDGVPNDIDPDIDGDGVVNWIDPDDNGNTILDVFDGDANGDLINDLAPGQTSGDSYFTEGIDFLAVQFEMKPRDDGKGNETTLKFTTKVSDAVTPLGVMVRGAPSLLQNATYTQKDDAGNDTTVAWNRQLSDDGLSEDSNPDDRLFAKHVVLENAKSPRAHEMVFIQLVFGTPDAPWYMEFPYAFPDLKPSPITAKYEPTQKQVLLVGSPFGSYQEFVWTINLYNADGQVVWSSQAIPGTTRQFKIAENAIEAGVSYTFSCVAQVLDKVPGYPSYAIYTKKYAVK
jgi:hypothetical protein